MNENKINVNFLESLLLFLCISVTLALGVGLFKIDLQVVLLICAFIVISYTMFKGISLDNIIKYMSNSIVRTYDAMIIFILIGATVGVWIVSGTIPSLIYYGLNILTPMSFLPAGLLICSLTSLATGTSWGTISTIGIALVGIGQSLQIPLPLVCGMVVSGAFFGDKISPMSDTTNLAAASTNTKLYDHIKSMLYTTIPAYLIALVIYFFMGLKYSNNVIDYTQVELIKNTLTSTFNISLASTLPIVVVIILSILKKPAIISMSFGILAGVIVSIVFQNNSLYDSLMVINNGYTISTGIDIVDSLIIRGGVKNMMSTFSLAFIAISLGGVLDEVGYLKVLVDRFIEKIKSVGGLVFTTIVSCILSNAIMGEAYLSIILNGNLYKKAYEDKDLDSSMLSRALEEGSTLTTGLIPWTTAGAFISATLGVSSFTYAPFAFFNLLNPLVSIVFSYLGIFVIKKKK